MHEMSIAVQLVAQIEESVRDNDVERVTQVTLDVGLMQLVVPEALRVAFESATEGTIAEGAKLVINEVAVEAFCRSCGHEYVPDIANYTCPSCLKADAEIVTGKDIILASIECETDEECLYGYEKRRENQRGWVL